MVHKENIGRASSVNGLNVWKRERMSVYLDHRSRTSTKDVARRADTPAKITDEEAETCKFSREKLPRCSVNATMLYAQVVTKKNNNKMKNTLKATPKL